MFAHNHGHERGGSVAGVVSMGVLAVGLALTAAEVPMAWVVWPLGYGVVLPLAVGYAARREGKTDSEESEPDPASRLRRRYVEGDIDEREFERKLEVVLEESRR